MINPYDPVGKEVEVLFPIPTPPLNGYVRKTPQDVGDCWVIEGKDGLYHYVMHFAVIYTVGGGSDEANKD